MYGEHKQSYDNHDGHGVKEEVYFPALTLLRNDSVHTVLNPDSGKVGSPQETSPNKADVCSSEHRLSLYWEIPVVIILTIIFLRLEPKLLHSLSFRIKHCVLMFKSMVQR